MELPADEDEEEEEDQCGGGRAYQSTLITAEDFLDGDGDGMRAYPAPSSFVGSARPPIYGYDFSFPDDDDDDGDDDNEGLNDGEKEEVNETEMDGDKEENDTHLGQVSTTTLKGQKNFKDSKTRRKS